LDQLWASQELLTYLRRILQEVCRRTGPHCLWCPPWKASTRHYSIFRTVWV